MTIHRVLASLIMGTSLCLIGYQSTFAQGMSAGAPASSVEGRTYCLIVDRLVMRSPGMTAVGGMSPFPPPAALFQQIVRRKVTFSGGVITGEFISRTRNTQDADTGAVTQSTPRSTAGSTGTYIQTGNKLALVIVLPTISISTTWYVSKDGSVINGTLSTLRKDVGPFGVDLGDTRNWTLIESNTCDTEGFITEL